MYLILLFWATIGGSLFLQNKILSLTFVQTTIAIEKKAPKDDHKVTESQRLLTPRIILLCSFFAGSEKRVVVDFFKALSIKVMIM